MPGVVQGRVVRQGLFHRASVINLSHGISVPEIQSRLPCLEPRCGSLEFLSQSSFRKCQESFVLKAISRSLLVHVEGMHDVKIIVCIGTCQVSKVLGTFHHGTPSNAKPARHVSVFYPTLSS